MAQEYENDTRHRAVRVALHARVSTTDKGQDPRNQIFELRRHSESKARSAPIIEYVEQETATGKKGRPVFEKMIQEAEHGRFDVLVIWALDRFSREGPLKTMLLLDRLHRAGVKVKSLKEPWLDPESPTYDLLLPIFAWIAKQEALRISERVRAGLDRARSSGTKLGRPRVVVDAAQISDLRARGYSWAEVRAELGVSKGTAQRALAGLPKNPSSPSDAST
jgi:DNA invertase Pin-like site-specific DNA recombinase